MPKTAGSATKKATTCTSVWETTPLSTMLQPDMATYTIAFLMAMDACYYTIMYIIYNCIILFNPLCIIM